MKKIEPSFNVIRALSALEIVFFHYCYTFYEYGIQKSGPDVLKFENGDFGGVFVAVFFMLSGAAILYNNPHLTDEDNPGIAGTLKKTGKFYIKRWLALFPMFYIAWIIMYIINSNRVGGWFWGGPRRNFLYSLFGMDGYFLHLGMNYYNLGEWFLGGIIFLYLLYPLLLFIWNRARIAGTVSVLFFFLFNLRRHFFSSAPDTNIFIVLIKYYNSHITISDNMCLWTCIMDFWCGFLLITYVLPLIKKLDTDENRKKRFIAIGIVLALIMVFLFVKLPLYKLESCTIMAILFYLLFTLITPFLMEKATLRHLIDLISKYSYGIFLVHHVILYGVMYLVRNFIFTKVSSVVFFIPVFALIFFAGYILTRVSGFIVSSLKSLFSRL